MPRSRSYQEDLLKSLQDPEEAAAYLNAALADGNEQVFLLALQNVADATIGPANGTDKRSRNCETLSEALLAQPDDPRLSTIRAILEGLGYRLAIEVSLPRA